MRGLWLSRRRLRLREDLPRPRLARGEARVGVRLAGICNTDLELLRGYYPFEGVPGHEFVGVVTEAADASWLGRRVVGEINAACGRCPTCAAGRRTHCPRRTALGIRGRDGAFADELRLPLANLHEVPASLPDEAAVFCEPLAAALEVLEQVEIARDDRVLVLGPGKLGTLVARALRGACDRVSLAGRRPERLRLLAREGFTALRPEAIVAAGYDVVVECTGSPRGFALARRALRPRGTLVLKSTYAGDTRLSLSSLVVDEITLVGSRCGPFAKALAALADGRVGVADLVEARYPLAQGLRGFAHARRPGALKVLLDPLAR
jgi:threonine dehydrogenase-like Zn-dependent dehydrogenase